MRRAALAALAVLALLAGCESGGPEEGQARLTGEGAEVRRPGRDWQPAADGLVPEGAGVRVRGDGRATLTLPSGGELELRRGSTVTVADAPVLVTGDLLVVTRRNPVAITATSVRVQVAPSAAARLSRTLAFDAAVYEGSAAVASAGRAIAVPALRQVSIAGPGLVPVRALALRYSEGDGWDRRYLSEAMALARDLEDRSRGLSAQVAPRLATSPAFYRGLLPGLPGDLDALLDAADAGLEPLPVGEKVVGATIALRGVRDTFPARWQAVFSFRRDGATWGLVAVDQGVGDPGLVGDLDLAIGRYTRPGEVAAPPSSPRSPSSPGPVSSPSPPPRSPGPSPSPGPPGGPPPPGGGSPSPTTTVPPEAPPTTVLPPPPETGIGVVDDLTDPLVGTVNGLLDGILNPGPSAVRPV